jgi:hypothetical protein
MVGHCSEGFEQRSNLAPFDIPARGVVEDLLERVFVLGIHRVLLLRRTGWTIRASRESRDRG